jgi:hypothetical protein
MHQLGVVLFWFYKKEHKDMPYDVMHCCCASFNKLEFLHALKKTQEQALWERSVSSVYWRTVILPFNPIVVLDKLSSYILTPLKPLAEHLNLLENVIIPPTPTTAQELSDITDYLINVNRDPSA